MDPTIGTLLTALGSSSVDSFALYRGASITLQGISVLLLGYFALKQYQLSRARHQKPEISIVSAEKSYSESWQGGERIKKELAGVSITLKNTGKGFARNVIVDAIDIILYSPKLERGRSFGVKGAELYGRIDPGEIRTVFAGIEQLIDDNEEFREDFSQYDDLIYDTIIVSIRSDKLAPHTLMHNISEPQQTDWGLGETTSPMDYFKRYTQSLVEPLGLTSRGNCRKND